MAWKFLATIKSMLPAFGSSAKASKEAPYDPLSALQEKGATEAHIAAYNNDAAAIEKLAASGVSLTEELSSSVYMPKTNNWISTPVEIAVACANREALTAFKKAGVPFNRTINGFGQTLAHIAVHLGKTGEGYLFRTQQEMLAFVDFLEGLGVPVNWRDNFSWSAREIALEGNDHDSSTMYTPEPVTT